MINKSKMAPSKSSGRSDSQETGFYKQLHNLSSVILYESKPRTVKTYSKTFIVERIIAKRMQKKVNSETILALFVSL